ncbi:hypothetical protein FRX31_034447 [Thalictrum thalictroides]|uniref:Uncharacterized protein n=1 Tax=Thalictrum thalictroides TaxID=46969 RepID=A0A7J6UTS9_THATH|nr:hypothetical protein FRX31_034447 [Thalictrum thalictroides]
MATMKRVLGLCIAAFLICSLFVETTNAEEDTGFHILHVEDIGLPVSNNGIICDGECPGGGARKLLLHYNKDLYSKMGGYGKDLYSKMGGYGKDLYSKMERHT